MATDKSTKLVTKDDGKVVFVCPSALAEGRTMLIIDGGNVYLTPGEVKKLAAGLLKAIGD